MKRSIRGALAVALSLGMASFAAAPALGQEGSASVRVAHFSPDAPNVDVYLDGEVALQDVAFKQVSDVLEIPAGSHDIAVRAAGSAADSAAVLSPTVDLAAGTAYTIAAVGLLDSIQAQVWEGAASRPGEGMAGVRAIHAAPEVGAVDVALADGTVVLTGLSFPDASEYLMLDPGTYQLDVRATGTTDALLMTEASVEGNTLYSIVAVGGGGQPAELIALVDAAGADTPEVLGISTGEGGTASDGSGMWLAIALGGTAVLVTLGIRRRATARARS